MKPGTEIDSAELEALVRLACGFGPRTGPVPPSNRQDADDVKASRLVRLSVDLMLWTRQAGLSPTESGCFFLLLATNLLRDVPHDAIAAMIGHLRSQPNGARR